MTRKTILMMLAMLSLIYAVTSSAGDGRIRRYTQSRTNEYIVVLKPEHRERVAAVSEQLARHAGGRVTDVWTRAVLGFATEMTEAQAEVLARHPWVEWVEENGVGGLSPTAVVNPETNWHLDRIDQASPFLSGTYEYCTTRAGG